MKDHTANRHRKRLARRVVPFAAALALGAGALTATAVATAEPNEAAAAPALSALDVEGRGAEVPFYEIEAETAAHNGTLIGPDSTYQTLPGEASGRQAVTLDAVGEYVEFTLTAPADAMTMRYSIPDNAQGTGIDAPIDLLVDGTEVQELPLTSRYGWFYGSYPFTNGPGAGGAHHFYDHVRTVFDRTLDAGTKVRVQVASTSAASAFTIDLADFEEVPEPIARPAESLSVVDFGADPTGRSDATAAFQAAVDAGKAQGAEVWIPEGEFLLYDHVIVDQVTVRGAGPWYSEITGRHPTDRSKAAGFYGKYVREGGPSTGVVLRDFAILGEITERVDGDQVNAIGGAMSDSLVENLWIQHVKVAAWMDGPMDDFHIRDTRMLDLTADAVNFHIGVTNSSVENSFVRNTGDDGLAMWAEGINNVGNSFTGNTVLLPILANGIAVYGGKDITVSDNVVADTMTNGGGLHVGNRYPGVNAGNGTDVQGTFTLARNTLIRTGNTDYNWPFPVGALWFDARNGDIDRAAINVTDTDIIDSTYAAIHFVSGTTKGVVLDGVRIDGTGTFAMQFNDPAEITAANVTATRIGFEEPVYSCLSSLVIDQGPGNSGWNGQLPATYCGPFPEPDLPGGGDPTEEPTDPTEEPTDPGGSNLALGKSVTATGHADVYTAANAVDGNAHTYWESANHAFPQSLTVDLGQAAEVGRVELSLPPVAAWEARTQTIAIAGSADGSGYGTILGADEHRFDPAGGNTVVIEFDPTEVRYLRLAFTGNTAWPAGQVSELEVYGP
jgi:hypothetical protein